MIAIADLFPGSTDPARKDVSDFFSNGGTAETFAEALDAATPYESPPFAGYVFHTGGDVGNGRHYVERHGHMVRYDGDRWLIYDGTRWAPDELGLVYELAKQVAAQLLEIAATEGVDDAQVKRLCAEAHRLTTHAGIVKMLAVAKSDPVIRVSPERFDRDPWLLNVRNGTINLRTGALRAHDPADLITNVVNVDHDPAARCTRFRAFIRQMFRHDEFLQRWFGYCLTGLTTEEKMLFAWGVGANGKTTLLNLWRWLMGSYAVTVAGEVFTAKPSSGPQPEVMRLRAKRGGIVSEMPEFQTVNAARMKGWTGRDTVVSRGLYQNGQSEFPMTAKFIVASNHRPAIHDPSDGAWRRIMLLPCTVQIAPEDQDPTLESKLLEELPGILAWAVEGCLLWQRDGLREPSEVTAATAEFRAESDALGQFFGDRCELGDGYSVAASDLYAAYRAWAEARGGRPMNAGTFGKQLTERGVGKRRSNGIVRTGIRLVDTPAVEYATTYSVDTDTDGPEW